MAKACAATSDKSHIRAPFAGPTELRDDLGRLRSLAVEDVHTVDGGGDFGAGGDAELARMLDMWTLAVSAEMDGSLPPPAGVTQAPAVLPPRAAHR